MPRCFDNVRDARFSVLGVGISVTNLAEAADKLCGWAVSRHNTYVCVAPVATVMDCQDDREYQCVINAAGMVTPDGMPLVWIGRSRGLKNLDRTYGPDLMRRVCADGVAKGLRHFFYGGTPKTLERLMQKLQDEYPGIVIAGSHAPGHLRVREEEQPEVIAGMNASAADILWVGLGSPKQDFWMAAHRDKVTIPVMVGAGAAFDFLAGTKPQAPFWIQRSGLEWLFRLVCEPRRLWRRYLIGNTRFVFLLLKDVLKGKPA